MRLKRCFAMFATVCLIFSVSLAPCSASEISDIYLPHCVNGNSAGNFEGLTYPYDEFYQGFLDIWYRSSGGSSPFTYSSYMNPNGFVYFTPVIGARDAYGSTIPNSSAHTDCWYPYFSFVSGSGAISSPATLYLSIGAVSTQPVTLVNDYSRWVTMFFNQSSGSYPPDYSDKLTMNTLSFYRPGPSPVNSSGNPWPYYSEQIVVRGDCNFTIDETVLQICGYSNGMHFDFTMPASTNVTCGYYIPYCYMVPTSAYLDYFDLIYTRLVSIDGSLGQYLPQIYGALQNIVSNLEDLNVDTNTIIEILNHLTEIEEDQLDTLNYILSTNQSIDTTVKQIHALMVTEVAGSDDLSDQAGAAADDINTNDVQEVHWQTQMSGNFDRLQLDGFSLTMLDSGLELVGNMFSSIWSAFGNWTIVFTFPLIFGIALLVIGRLSKHGGGNSSRNSEHKGGEGGA